MKRLFWALMLGGVGLTAAAGRVLEEQLEIDGRYAGYPRFDTGFSVDAAELEKMQHRAHRYCFIANTLADNVEINIL